MAFSTFSASCVVAGPSCMHTLFTSPTCPPKHQQARLRRHHTSNHRLAASTDVHLGSRPGWLRFCTFLHLLLGVHGPSCPCNISAQSAEILSPGSTRPHSHPHLNGTWGTNGRKAKGRCHTSPWAALHRLNTVLLSSDAVLHTPADHRVLTQGVKLMSWFNLSFKLYLYLFIPRSRFHRILSQTVQDSGLFR
ncbi:hypothetical protein GGR57DRAFT_158674 [Xylariaceae sp. FL1272]|nr:hypothetical protein GGR57DRAFT_158674 [Xylariaceae sp. FL1272]